MSRVCSLLFALCVLALGLCSRPARADDDQQADEQQAEPSSLDIVALPIFGEGTLPPGGWGEVLVRIQNRRAEPVQGTVQIRGGWTRSQSDDSSESHAPFAVGASAIVSLRIPIRVSEMQDPVVIVREQGGQLRFEQSLARALDNRSVIVDVARSSALGANLRGIIVGSRNDPWAATFRGYAPGSVATTVHVASPMYDPTTGDALLPRRAAGYARIAAVLMRSDELVRIGASELEALAGYLMAGGTLAIIVTRPEDQRHAVMRALLGGEVSRAAPASETLAPLRLSMPSSAHGGSPGQLRAQPEARHVGADLEARLVGWSGANLHPSSFGASAAYGLGEVHLLAFDPQNQPAVDSAWAQVRMVDLVRRANERVSHVLFRHGATHSPALQVRERLDPNESSSWAIIVCAILLCLYAVLAGPINFAAWRNKHRPLNALVWLGISSALAFGAVVTVAVAAKGCSGRARHLTMVEAGAGMTRGTARRWRGFFVPGAREMTIRTPSSSGVLGTEVTSHGDSVGDVLRIDHDGLRLADMGLRPWETLVIREDGYADLGAGISLLRTSDSETEVVNKSGRRLLGVVLWQPVTGGRYLRSLDDGATVSSRDFASVSITVSHGAPPWELRDFNMHAIHREFDTASVDLALAWSAVVDAIPERKDWFPRDVPVLLAQLDGGEGESQDSGLRIDSDRVLIRVVGYGGTP